MNLQVKTTDNSSVDVSAIADGHLDDLKKLSERPLRELDLEEHPNLLVFPQDFKTHGDDIGKEHIFTIAIHAEVGGIDLHLVEIEGGNQVGRTQGATRMTGLASMHHTDDIAAHLRGHPFQFVDIHIILIVY